MVADYAYDYLDEAMKSEKPFFIGIAPITPHSQVGNNSGPPVPEYKYAGSLSHATVPRSKNFNPDEVSKLPLKLCILESLHLHQAGPLL